MKKFFFLHILQTHLEQEDLIITHYYPDGKDSMSHTLDVLDDLKSPSDLEFNTKNIVKLKTPIENSSVNTTMKK